MIKSFEGGRGIAAIFVALFHLGFGASHISWIRNGYLFVDLFFVLSGFLIFFAYSRKLEYSHALRPFLIRRFGRLFPLLVFATVAYVVLQNLMVFAKSQAIALGYASFFQAPGLLEYKIPTAPEILSTLTLTHSLGFFDSLILNYASWSISTEFYTYVLFAMLCLLTRGRTRIMALSLVCATAFLLTAWASIVLHHCLEEGRCFDVSYDFGLVRCISSFFLGALTCHFSRSLQFNANYLQAAALLLLLALFSFMDAYPWLAFCFSAVCSVLILSISRDTGILAALFKSKPLQAAGERSYSIYMMHPVVLLPLIPYRENIHGFVMSTLVMAAYLTVLLIVSGWTYRFIENPFRRLFNRMAGAAPPERIAPQTI
ncbi:MAG: acyltransferase [Pseudomonadota bacterium]|nr:acyltransferase [Pseudomonadota bacterium]